MKVLHDETIAWILCIILVILPTLARPPPPPPPPAAGIQYTKLTWELDYEPKTYSTFISSLRTAFNSFGKVCEIPVTPKSPEPKDAFILVDIINTSGKTITVAFQTSNLYFVGFMDKTTDDYTRANFVFNDFDKLKGSDLFKDAKIKKQLPYKESYTDLEKVAGSSRRVLSLGIVSFSSSIDTIYGKDYKGEEEGNDKPKPKPKPEPEQDIGQNLAKFALMAIQMIAEATRFKYIEGKVEELGIYGTFKPDDTFIKLQTNWGTFSELIHRSSPCCKPVKSPAGFPKWSDIKEQVGLLNHVDKVFDVVPPFMEGIFGNNADADADDVALGFIM